MVFFRSIPSPETLSLPLPLSVCCPDVVIAGMTFGKGGASRIEMASRVADKFGHEGVGGEKRKAWR